jgi:signal peptidase I
MTSQPQLADRNPWIAVALSLFCTGLGHLYSGKIVRGMGLFLASLLFVPLVGLGVVWGSAIAVQTTLFIAISSYLVVLVIASIDAWRISRSAGREYVLRDYNHLLVYGVFVLIGITYPWFAAYVVREFFIEAFVVPSASMAPTVLPGDHILASKLEYRLRSPQRFDIIVFRLPGSPERRYIKRLIGLPGDTVEVKNGRIRINGQDVAQEPVRSEPREQFNGEIRWEMQGGRSHRVIIGDHENGKSGEEFPPSVVPHGSYFVLGDNRDRSRDSRQFSFVPGPNVVGKVQCIYWPAQSWQRSGPIR